MEKLNELIRAAEATIAEIQGDVDRQKGMFDVSRLLDRIDMWNMRLGALNEAKTLWMEDEFKKCSESEEYFMERHGRIQKPEPGSVNIDKVVQAERRLERSGGNVEEAGSAMISLMEGKELSQEAKDNLKLVLTPVPPDAKELEESLLSALIKEHEKGKEKEPSAKDDWPPQEHDRKDVEVGGRKYAVAWEHTDIGDLCWMGDDAFPNKLYKMDMHAYAPAYNYNWKVMHIYGENVTPMEMRAKVDAFLDKLSGWDESIDPSEAFYDIQKFCRIRNDAGEDVRHYLRELIDMLDGNTDVSFFQDGVQEMKEEALALIGEMDAVLADKMVL